MISYLSLIPISAKVHRRQSRMTRICIILAVFLVTEKEIAISADAKELFNAQIGDNIILNMPAGDFNYTISGFYEDDEEFNDIIDGTCMYMCRATFDEVRNLNSVEPTSQFYIRFQKENNLKKMIAGIKEQYALTRRNLSRGLSAKVTNCSIIMYSHINFFSTNC